MRLLGRRTLRCCGVGGVWMGFEIERKFLLRDDRWRKLAQRKLTIRQAYLSSNGKNSIRVRIRNDETATLTVKSRPTSLRRLELEYQVPLLEAEAMMALRQGAVIEKLRYIVPWDDLQWEIDVFLGENAGLLIAEIELREENQLFRMPDWIGEEITGRSDFYNSSLVLRPYTTWPQQPEEASELRA
jgi:adenylate cyclase